MSSIRSISRGHGAVGIIILITLAAVVVNLVIYGIATIVGASFDFTDNGESYHVDVLTLIGFTAIPLLAGLTVVAILGRWWRGVLRIALVIAPIIAVGTIFTMTIPADFDTASTIALATAHVVVAIAVAGEILALRSLAPKSAFRFA